MKHLGDITNINGAAAPPANVIIGGSPCQDLSVAGKRAGLAGERSGLFMEQIRIIKEMRKASEHSGANDIKPRYMVWENVPGAFSSNKGQDFKPYLKKQSALLKKKTSPIFLSLMAVGTTQGVSWETDSPLLGEFSTRSFGECPNVAVESHLSQILEDSPHPRYSLSAKACSGILRRAERRGKTLPPLLKNALERQIDQQGTDAR